MEVRLDKRYALTVGVDAAWRLLADVRGVAGCMPGAQITEQIDDTHFKGLVRSRVGPAQMVFSGDIELLACDAAAHAIEMLGKGADRGGSSAAMRLAARLEPAEAGTGSVLVGEATVTVSGKLAQFGGRLLVPVADAMLAQFAQAFEANAAALAASETAPAPAPVIAADGAPAHEAGPAPAGASASEVPIAVPDASAPGAATPPPIAAPAPAPRPAATITPAAAPRELDALGLAWAVFRGWWRGLFGKKAA